MTATVAGIHLGIDTHANRPAANTVPDGSLYSCSTHSLVYKSNYAGNSWATWATLGSMTNPMTTAGDVIYGGASGTPTRLAIGTAAQVLKVNAGATAPEWGAASGSGTAFQAVADPTTFDGSDTIDGSSTTPFADVDAFTAKTVEGNTIHLQTTGASKDDRVRVTLGTTKAAAFDIRTQVAFNNEFWSAAVGDTYLEILGSTSGGSQLFIARIMGILENANTTTPRGYYQKLRVGHTAITAADANFEPVFPLASSVTLRVVRDGSNVLAFYFGIGSKPLTLGRVTVVSNLEPYAPTSAGTLARIEYSIHTPTGPGASASWDAWIAYLTNN
jgi:hypothetical protein